jgi:hypothetical protein
MKNTIFIILGLGGLFYLLKSRITTTPTTAPTPTPTPVKPTGVKTTTTKPKIDLSKTPIGPPAFKINDILRVKLPFLQDMSYDMPFGKQTGNVKEGIYLGYSSVYGNWIKIRATFAQGIYNVPTTRDVWVKAINWKK